MHYDRVADNIKQVSRSRRGRGERGERRGTGERGEGGELGGSINLILVPYALDYFLRYRCTLFLKMFT